MKLKGEIEIILCFFILVGFLSAIVPSSLSSANEISSFSSTLDSFNGESSYVRAINSYNVSIGEVISANYKDSFNREEFIPGSYIIQLESPSIIEKHSSLKKEKEEKLKNSFSVSGQTRGDSSFQILSNEIDEEINETIEEYEKEIVVQQKNVLLEIESEIFKEDSEGFFEGATDFINFFSLSLTGKAIFSSESSINPGSVYQNVLNGFTLENLTQEQALAIENLDSVKKVYPNKKVYATLSESVPLIQDGVLAGQLDRNGNDCLVSGEECLTGKGVKIAIIDTGVDYTHSDLGGCTAEEFLAGECEKVIGGYDFVNEDSDPFDDMGHGTHCAAIAAGNGTLKGVALGAEILAYKVLDSGGSGSMEGIIAGIEKAVEDGADILSLSLGGRGNPDDVVSQAIDNAFSTGVIAVIAAGNSGPHERTIGSPGTARKAITVGAFDKNDVIADFSSRGPVIWTDENGSERALIKPDILAPGVEICAAQASNKPWNDRLCLDDSHVAIDGTSMATPHVAGVVALLKQKNPDWTPEEIKFFLKGTAIDLGYSPIEQGAGRVNVSAVVELEDKLPILYIDSSGKFSGSLIEVIGTAKGENFNEYTLYYSSGFSDWIQICSSNESRDVSVLCSWNAEDLYEGEYYLKLESEFNQRLYTEYGFIEIKNTEISSPIHLKDYDSWYSDDKVIWRFDEPINISGTASGKNFESYSLEWCDEEFTSCSQEGIIYGGSKKVEKGLLGTWEIPSDIVSGFYYLVLKNNYLENIHQVVSLIYVETDLLEGWPRKQTISGEGIYLSFLDQPNIIDIDGDGKNNLVTSYETTINVLDELGNSLPGWPVEINTSYFLEQKAIMQYGPVVGDLDGDGSFEIVVGDNAGYIHILKNDGTYVLEPKKFGTIVGTPTLADLNEDGFLEIIWSDWWSFLYVVDKDLNLLEGFPKDLSSAEGYPDFRASYGSVSIADLNNDKDLELIVESSSCNSDLFDDGSCWSASGKSQIWVIDKQGNVLDGWPRQFNYLSRKDLIIVDLNSDGNKEIVFGTFNGSVFALDYLGENISGWPISIYNLPEDYFNNLSEDSREYLIKSGSADISGISVGDINLDGNVEVIFTGRTLFNETIWGIQELSCIFVYDFLGRELAGFPICGDYINFKTGFSGAPTIANLDDDPEMEIFTPDGYGYYVNNLAPFYAVNHDGSIVEGFPKYLDDSSFGNVLPAGDLNMDGHNEFLVGTWTGNTFIYSFSGVSGRDDWPMFQHDAQHTGCYDCAQTKYIISYLNYLPDWELNEDNNISIVLNNEFEESKSVNYSLSYSKCNYSNRLDCIYLQITEGNKELSSGEIFTENISFSFSETGEYILMLDIVGDKEAKYYYSLNVFEESFDEELPEEEYPSEEDPYEKSSLEGYFLDSKFFADIPSNISFEITNYGSYKTENASYSLYYQKDLCYINYEFLPCDNLSLLAFEEIELGSGEEISIQKEISFEEGEYTFILILNYSNHLGEIYPVYDFINVNPPGPDLNVNVVEIDYTDNLFVGDEKEFFIFVENVGTEKSKDIVLEMYDSYYSHSKIILKNFNLGNLNPGENVSVRTSYIFDKKGFYYFSFELKSKEDVNFDNNYESLFLDVIVEGVDVGIKEENVYVSFYSSPFKNFILGSLSNFGSQVILEEDANLSFFIDDSFIDSKLFSFESSSEYFSFEIPKEFYGKNVSVNLTLFIQGDVDLTDNFFRKDFLIPNFLNVSFLVKNSSGSYADRYLVDLLNEDFYSTFEGVVNITIVEQQGSLAMVFSETPFNFSSDYYQAAIFERSSFDNSEEIITDRYEKISEENKDYYFVHTFNTSFNYSSFAFYYQEKNEKLESLVEEETPDMFQIVYCTHFDIPNKKCISDWEVFENIEFRFDESYFILAGYLENFSVEAVGLTLKENLKGTDEKSISNGVSKEYKKYNSYGEISFKEEVNVSRIKNNQKLLENIQIGPRKIFINESNLPELVNKNATITFRGIHFNNPRIMKNGLSCGSCFNILYDLENKTLTSDILGFSEYVVVEGPYCGDGVCQSNENKNNCPSDCSSTGGGGGGGSGGSGGGSAPSSNSLFCITNWSCTWGECINKIRTEKCVDLNFCQTLANKPEEKTEVCFIETSLNLEKVNNSESFELEEPSNNFYLILLIIVFVFSIFFIILFIFFIFFNKKNNLKQNNSFSEAQLKMKNLLEQGNYFVANEMKTEALKIYIEIKNLYSTSNEFKSFYEEILKFYSNLNKLV